MIERYMYQDIIQFKMGRAVNNQVLYWAAVYLVDGLLIDTGPAHTAHELLAELRREKVEKAVNTHYHEDHIGGNALLQRELGIEIFAPVKSIERIAAKPALYPYQELVWGCPEPSRPNPLGKEVRTGKYRFEVIETPGHSDDHVVFWLPEKGWLFAGDLFVSETPKTARPEDNQGEIIASLQKVHRLHPQVLFTGLGNIVEEATGALARTILYLERIRDQVDRFKAQGFTPAQMVREIFGRESALKELTQGQFSSENFVRSFDK
ncbi:MAG: MBL fold metallo-hydrolase [Bacillota bacterium]